MNSGSDLGWYIFLAPFALAIVLSLALVVRSLKILLKNFRSPHKFLIERTAFVCFVAAFIFLIHFWFVGRFNKVSASQANSGFEAQVGAILLLGGVLLAYVAYPPHRRTGAEKTALAISRFKWPWWRRHKIVMSAFVLLVLLSGIVVYQKLAESANRHNFEQARIAIDSVYADVVAQVGQPDNYDRLSSCARAHQEFTQGPLSCDLNTDFIYPVNNENDANKLFKKIQELINSQDRQLKSIGSPGVSITDTLVVNSYYHTASDKYRVSGLNCVVNYVFDTPREIDLSIKDKSKKPFEVVIGCYGPARQQYYPLAS